MNRDRFSVKRNREMCTTTSHEHEFVQVDEEVGTLPSSLGFSLRFFISRLRHDLSDCTARSAKLDGDHSWIADQFAAELLQVRSRLLDIVDLNRKMMDARSEPRSACLGRVFAVVLDQGEIDCTVG